MHQRLLPSDEEKLEVYCIQLIKYGMSYEKAVQAARLLVSGKPDELTTQEEIELVNQARELNDTYHKVRFFLKVKNDAYKSII